jgi:hypothetical protein
VPLLKFSNEVLDNWPSSLPQSVSRLFYLMADSSAVLFNMVTHSEFELPFGVATRSSLVEAYAILNQLPELIKLHQTQLSDGNSIAFKATEAKIVELSNAFHMLVPSTHSQVSRINTAQQVQKFMDSLNSLSQQNAAAGLLMAAASNVKTMHPYECLNSAVNTNITPVLSNSEEFLTLNKYFKSTSETDAIEIVDILRVSRSGEENRFGPYQTSKNRTLLWHG